MRRQDREIEDIDEKIKIIEKCKVCRIALSENNMPYIVPLNYGYSFENNVLTLFFHSAAEGKKLDIIKNNNNACFEIDCDSGLVEGKEACDYGYAYKSIIGFGKIIILEKPEEKIDGLNKLMKHQTGKDIVYQFPAGQIDKVCVFMFVAEEFTGKHRE